MSVIEMQSCMARLYVDALYRQLFFIDPDAALAGYSLDDAEALAIKATDAEKLELFAGFVYQKRLYRLEKAYPAFFRLKLDETNLYCERYCQLYLDKPEWAEAEDVIGFGKFIEQTLAANDNVPHYASELMKYERMLYAAKYHSALKPVAEMASVANLQSNVTLNTRPVISDGVQVGRFRYEVSSVYAELMQGSSPTEVHEAEHCLIVQGQPDSSTPKTFRLSVAAADVLELCYDRRPVKEIIEIIEQQYETGGLQEQIMMTVNQLLTLKVLKV